jgi:hypothetical protein
VIRAKTSQENAKEEKDAKNKEEVPPSRAMTTPVTIPVAASSLSRTMYGEFKLSL